LPLDLTAKQGGMKSMFKNLYKYDDMKRAEHDAVRKTAGWYYFTHQLLEVTGADAAAFLDKMFAKPIANLAPENARYTTMLDEDGLIIDDVIVFRWAKDAFWISTLYLRKMVPWFDAHKGTSRVEYKDITESWDMYAVQGPKSKDLLNAMLENKIDDQKFFTIRDNRIGGIPVKISRAGFSGEKLGYEIYVAPESRRKIEEALEEKGKAFGAKHVEEFQIMVWTLPTEKGLYLMTDIGRLTPFEAGLDQGIDWSRDFIGKEALEKIRGEQPKRAILGYILDEDDTHVEARDKGGAGAKVILNGEEVGRVLKYTYGYTCGKSIGYALVDSAKARVGDKVMLNDYHATLTERVFI
jgi:aminomethyltransferase